MSGDEERTPGFRVEPLFRLEDFQACVALQEEIWGMGFSQRVPEAVLLIAERLGGVVSGARLSDGSIGGFVFGLTGIERGRWVHWSDMLAVRAELRGRGVGTALKLHQRERVMELGVRTMYWTFDPLEARNARLNLTRFGAVVREYVAGMYGASGSPLHAGIGTDRFVATWELDSDRVRGRLVEGGAAPPRPEEMPRPEEIEGWPRALEVAWEDGWPVPVHVAPEIGVREGGVGGVRVPVPPDIQALKAAVPELAARWRDATRAVFTRYLERGWEVRELVHDGGLPHYLLVPSEPGGGGAMDARNEGLRNG